MNIFVVDTDPIIAAQSLCDKHVIKMILETAQLLCSTYEPNIAPYKRTHYNHPCAIWIRRSLANYNWLIAHGHALNAEYIKRFNSTKDHASVSVINWCDANKDKLNLPDVGLTPFVQAMPEDCKDQDAVLAYRNYYVRHKQHIATWKNATPPNWWIKISLDK